jgi:hypothetical protein
MRSPPQTSSPRFNKIGIFAQPSAPDDVMKRLKADIQKWDAVREKAGIAKK